MALVAKTAARSVSVRGRADRAAQSLITVSDGQSISSTRKGGKAWGSKFKDPNGIALRKARKQGGSAVAPAAARAHTRAVRGAGAQHRRSPRGAFSRTPRAHDSGAIFPRAARERGVQSSPAARAAGPATGWHPAVAEACPARPWGRRWAGRVELRPCGGDGVRAVLHSLGRRERSLGGGARAQESTGKKTY